MLRKRAGEGCSTACRARIALNDAYFGGRMFEADGWANRQCQACGKLCQGRRFQVHHVFGHPDHSWLMVLCPGCHGIVSVMARSKRPIEADHRLAELAEMRRTGRRVQWTPPAPDHWERAHSELAACVASDWLSVSASILPRFRREEMRVVEVLEHAEARATRAKLPVALIHQRSEPYGRALVVTRLHDFLDWFGGQIGVPEVEEAG